MAGRGRNMDGRDVSRRASPILLALSLVCFITASPQTAAADTTVDCQTATEQKDLNTCAAEEAEKANDDMENVLAAARQWGRVENRKKTDAATNPVNFLDVLELSQRGWIDYRDGQCLFASLAEKDPLKAEMLSSRCETEMTRERVQELLQLVRGTGK